MSLLPLLPRFSFVRYSVILLSLITISNIAYGQITYGTVTDNKKAVDGAIIRNLKSGRVSMTSNTGVFIMVMKKGDTLLTDFPEYKTDTTIYNNQSPLLIAIKPLNSLLDEVTIWERQMNPEEKLQKRQDEYYQIYRIGDNSNWIIGALGLNLNLSPLYNRLSKSVKNARKLQKTIARDYQDDVIDSRFTKALVSQYTHLDGQPLENFMIDNRPSYTFIKGASDYDLIEYIIKTKKDAETNHMAISNKSEIKAQ